MSTLEAFARTVRRADVTVPFTGPQIRAAVSMLLTVAAVVLFVAAAWLVAMPLGLAVAGVGCIVLDEKIPGRGSSGSGAG